MVTSKFNQQALRAALAHVLWIGGGTGAGKSSIAAALAETYGLRHYAYDRAEPLQIQRMRPQQQPHFLAFLAMTLDERWLLRSSEAMAETTLATQEERFALTVEDLLALPADQGIIAEGFGLRPDLVHPLLTDPRKAIWLVPTPAFRRAALAQRQGLWSLPNQTSDPERALHNRLERDRLLGEHSLAAARERGLSVLLVDGERDLAAMAALVEQAFAPFLHA